MILSSFGFIGLQMAHQLEYDNQGGKPWPEKQFLEVLKDRKVRTLVGGLVLSLTAIVITARAAQQARPCRS
jgi:hypothetical protein